MTEANIIAPAEKGTLATVLDDPAYAGKTHAEVAAAINAATVEIPRTLISLDEIYEMLDPAEIAAMETGTAVGFWRLLEQGQFDLTGKPFALFRALCPPTSLKAIDAHVATTRVVPLGETLGFSRALDFGDIAAVKGFEPDFLDIETNELQNASGLSTSDRAAIDAKNAETLAHIDASPVLARTVQP